MKSLKKILLTTLACMTAATSVAVLSACDFSGENFDFLSKEHTHVWDDGKITTPATCETDGEKTYSCRCGETRKEAISATGHDYADKVCTSCGELKPSEGLEYAKNIGNDSYSVTGIGKCTDTVLVIPETYKGLPVTMIGDYAFYYCSSLTSVEIPDSVTTIDRGAFRECYGLTSVEIPDSVTTIGDYAFYNCSGLTSVYYGGDVAGWCSISFEGYHANPLH